MDDLPELLLANSTVEGEEFLSPKHQRALGLVRDLVQVYQAVKMGKQVARPEKDHFLLDYLEAYEYRIVEAHTYFRQATQTSINLTFAAEWVLDNFYIIRQAIREIREDLPVGYYKQLPILAGDQMSGYPRMYALAREILMANQIEADEEFFELVITGFQQTCPLTMGEIWALPIFLRFTAVEILAHSLTVFLPGPNRPALPGWNDGEILDPDQSVANAVICLRVISDISWQEFFESTSQIEAILQNDPSGVYAKMDFNTRNYYRGVIEKLAQESSHGEHEIANQALRLAYQAYDTNPARKSRKAHIGYYLIDQGRQDLEHALQFKPVFFTSTLRWIRQHSQPLYLAWTAGLALMIVLILSIYTNLYAADPIWWLAAPLLTLIPALTVSVSVINWLITLFVPPSHLPKLDFHGKYATRATIPADCQTVIVMPCLLTGLPEIDRLVQQLEMHYLRNSEDGLFFGLLSDFSDAPDEHRPEDNRLVEHALSAISVLNARYPLSNGYQRFHLFHRRRMWNQQENTWMGWERKRGKLHELNRLLRGVSDYTFTQPLERPPELSEIRYVITLDADTILPTGVAARLIGTMAHPLNQAVFSADGRTIISGYSVLQPRMEITPASSNRNLFTQIFAGDTGLDLYSRAVSDPYQDFICEGIYVGKGIYDIDAFEKSTSAKIPENTILSHDLLEGIMGRAGLATDITLVEDYPTHYQVFSQRQHRWIRGDWQLLPWLVNPARFGARFSPVNRWKIFDNLRRSLLFPSLLVLIILGLTILPGAAWVWISVSLLTLAAPLATSIAQVSAGLMRRNGARPSLRPVRTAFLRWALAVAFMLYEANLSVHAILITLYRVLFSHRNLLQWTTAAQAALLFRMDPNRQRSFQLMGQSSLVGIIGLLISAIYRPDGWILFSILSSAWLATPFIIHLIHRPLTGKLTELSAAEIQKLRAIACRTWSFFEEFASPSDHWLPPDHFQESPLGVAAHRTSPSNIGLLLTSISCAYDLGYLDLICLIARLTSTFDTLKEMERHRGHFFNWYDTVTLKPLYPRYISTVDSGNLAACLIMLDQTCNELHHRPIFRWENWLGYLDRLQFLEDCLNDLMIPGVTIPILPIFGRIQVLREHILEVKEHPHRWYRLYLEITRQSWPDISNKVFTLLQSASLQAGESAQWTPEHLRNLRQAAEQLERNHQAIERNIQSLAPWIPLMETPPEALSQNQDFLAQIHALRDVLSYRPAPAEIRNLLDSAYTRIDAIRDTVKSYDLPEEQHQQVFDWLDRLSRKLLDAAATANVLISGLLRIQHEARKYIEEMQFGFLFHPDRQIFHIGYNLDSNNLDRNFYDLLASEARIASLIAIGKGDIPQSHWVHLSRPVTRIDHTQVLLSWSATMFEYLMPPLFLRTYPGTLLAESVRGAVLYQMQYCREKGVPWGISESGYYRFDPNQSYQYRAFGAPGLGFKRGLGFDLVIAPYASMMAAPFFPDEVSENADRLIDYGMLGPYGFYEAIDFTAERLDIQQKHAIVREYMAHHQGMTLLGLNNYLNNQIILTRMHNDPLIRSVELLLQEQTPFGAQDQAPESEEAKGLLRMTSDHVDLSPWTVPTHTPTPQVHLISNGTYSVLIDNSGGGFSRWNDLDLTRWQADPVSNGGGAWIYLQTLNSGERFSDPWSATTLPIPSGKPDAVMVTYHPHMAVFRRDEHEIISTLEVTVAAENAVELRRLQLTNTASTACTLRTASYGEVILASQASDTRHPAFNKMFIESEFVPKLNLLIFKRRKRSSQEKAVFLGHMLTMPSENTYQENLTFPNQVTFETDRRQFIGRGKNLRRPEALSSETGLSGSVGATLDPIFSICARIDLPAHASTSLSYITFAASSREELIEIAARYKTEDRIDRAFHQSRQATRSLLNQTNVSSRNLEQYFKTLSAIIYPTTHSRAPSSTLITNRLGQSGLWRFGISGDFPILLIHVHDPDHIDLLPDAFKIYRYLRARRFLIDVVIINEQQTNYGAQVNNALYRLISRTGNDQWLNQRGGIFILIGDQIHPEEYTLLRSAARLEVDSSISELARQVPGYDIQIFHLPELSATLAPSGASSQTAMPPVENLQFFNGYGGFSQDGREYVIDLPPGRRTPAPWCNVIGYPDFGFLITEAGSGFTWAINSGENRLTTWSNDPVCDPASEATYLRDEDTGEVWTPTPLPAGAEAPYRIRHGAGYTTFEHHSHELIQHMQVFAAPDAPVKLLRLRLRNQLGRPRRISVTQYVEWQLGPVRSPYRMFIIPEYDAGHACLLARNTYNAEFGERCAFLAASRPIHGVTCDRIEFIGRNGSLASPVALRRIGLKARIDPGEDPCAALQVQIDLPAMGEEVVYFMIGQAAGTSEALALVDRFHDPAQVENAWQATGEYWSQLLEGIQVHTKDPAFDLMFNRWLLYQSLSCRVWGRSGFYQSSGAYGFRDQLQDVMAVLATTPEIARSHIIEAAAHQFEAGDVLHWWHPPSGRGVRTRFSDDLLWLPYVVSQYVETTGDLSILSESVPFLDGPPLKEEEEERYAQYTPALTVSSLFEHCRRAVVRGSTAGRHGLPLMGTGDWNDGMNRVGVEGSGESVWLAWFLYDVLNRFARLCELSPDTLQPDLAGLANDCRAQAERLKTAIEDNAWDGAWYRRAYFDSNAPLGSFESQECKIDAIAQSWAVLSGAAPASRARQALHSLYERLVKPEQRLILLFTPPFDQSPFDPGYVKGYLPGVRENGGQYTHAAVWSAWAFAALGDGITAGEMASLLNPVYHSDTPEKAETYRVEPYVIAADIYSVAPYIRRGGWTWYTGSSSWMYRFGIEGLLGIQKMGQSLRIQPVIPPEWDGYEVFYQYGKSRYHIRVRNPRRAANGVQSILLDGQPVAGTDIPLSDDGADHDVEIVMSAP